MSDAEGEASGELTLAFDIDAIRRFADPEAVFAEAREWSRSVGVVANDTDAVASFVAEHDLTQDFDLVDRDIWLTMEHVREAHPAPRHVYVGSTHEDRRIADATDWEFRRPETVAESAEWSLGQSDGDANSGPGLLARLRSQIAALVPGRSDG